MWRSAGPPSGWAWRSARGPGAGPRGRGGWRLRGLSWSGLLVALLDELPPAPTGSGGPDGGGGGGVTRSGGAGGAVEAGAAVLGPLRGTAAMPRPAPPGPPLRLYSSWAET